MSEAPVPENVDNDSNVITTPVNGLEVMAAMAATVAPAPKPIKRRRSRKCRDGKGNNNGGTPTVRTGGWTESQESSSRQNYGHLFELQEINR